MKITDFNAKKKVERDELLKRLKNMKLEKVLSLWYVIRSRSKATIIGSKS